MNENVKKGVKYIFIGGLLVAFAVCLCRQLHDDGGGADGVTNGIKAAGHAISQGREQQSEITAGIGGAKGTAQSIRDGIAKADGIAGRAAAEIEGQRDALAKCRASVRRCQQILAGIQRRGTAEAIPP